MSEQSATVFGKADIPEDAVYIQGDDDREMAVVTEGENVTLYVVPKTGRPSRFACRASDLVSGLLKVKGLNFPTASGEPPKSGGRMTY